MSSPYTNRYTELTSEPVKGSFMITRQELVSYEWRNDSLFRVTTTRKFSNGGSDYIDEQTVTPVYSE